MGALTKVEGKDIYDVQLTSRPVRCREVERKAWICTHSVK